MTLTLLFEFCWPELLLLLLLLDGKSGVYPRGPVSIIATGCLGRQSILGGRQK